MSDRIWTDKQFEEMSWHDNHVHALRIVEGQNGAGELILDLDYIVEWINAEGSFRFRVLPVTLTFFGVFGLRILLDYKTPTAATGPFSLAKIERRIEQRERYVAQCWILSVNWPEGEMTFEATGFEQKGRWRTETRRPSMATGERAGPRRIALAPRSAFLAACRPDRVVSIIEGAVNQSRTE
jgi:hypothetical protein